ncbi:hypothetical protein AXF42_Ash006496 [Apostasia shenzhenica]|uniref:Uncharacterized protein n=1 Tax=Apostasia shenzhenica TaxID=1088818 RepID=A0A2I0AZ89_9ASPA|nr:hypothetical protein AXF42_Ash006496 [Apostasia shenzhenica]
MWTSGICINVCETLVGIFVGLRRRASVTMSVFSGVAGFVRDEPPEAGGPAQSSQASTRRPLAREEAPKRLRICLSNSGGVVVDAGSSRGAVRGMSRSLQCSVPVTPPVESTVIVADDEVQSVEEGAEARPSAPLTTDVPDGLSRDRSTLTPVSSPSGHSVGLEISSGVGQKGPDSGSSSTQFEHVAFVRTLTRSKSG